MNEGPGGSNTARHHQLRMGRFYETSLKGELSGKRASNASGAREDHQNYVDVTLARDSDTANKLRNYQQSLAKVKRRLANSVTPAVYNKEPGSKDLRRGASLDIFSSAIQATP